MPSVHEWFSELYEKYHKKLLRIAMHMTRDLPLAEDMVQTVFLTLLAKHEMLQNHPDIWGWLRQALKYQILNEMQRAHRSREVPLSQEQATEARESRETDFFSLLPAELSYGEKLILYLHIEAKLTHEEIGARIGCSEEASRMRLYRAKRRCKKFLEKSLQ